tara:strand:- start:4017 stop:4496 length:480 start_codon:yes stop_codon:yes gene_type:complete
MKILGIDLICKWISLFFIALPLPIVLLIPFVIGNYSLIYSNGYLVYFSFYSLITFFFLKWTSFTYTIHVINNKLVVKSWITKGYYLDKKNAGRIDVNPISVLSTFFKLYKIQLNERTLLIQYNRPISFLDRFFRNGEISKEIENNLANALNKTNYEKSF